MDANRSVMDVFSDLVDQMSTLFRKEIQLAKAEMSEKAAQAAAGAGMLVAGGLMLLVAFIFLLHGVVAWLDHLGMDARWGYVAVAVVVGATGAVMLSRGRSDLKATNLTPTKTTDQLSRDAAVVREQVR